MKQSIRWLAAASVLALVTSAFAEEAAQTGAASSAPVAPATPASPASSAAPAKTSSLKVEIKIGKGVADREATDVADSFSGVDELVGWTKVVGANEPIEITHVWMLDGKEVKSIPLQVKSASFRTWTKKGVAGQPGKWTLAVKDASGATLASKDVEVTAAK